MARSFLPDPLELLRQAISRLDGRPEVQNGRGVDIDQLMKRLLQMSSLSLALRQAVEMAMESFYKRLNLPTGREFAEMTDRLQRIEDKLDSLLAAQVLANPRPPRARKPGAAPAAAKTAKPRPAAAPSRRQRPR